MAENGDEFYVGYLPRAPGDLARHIRRTVALLLLVGIGVSMLLVTGQAGFAPSVYEFGVERALTGVLREHPFPILQVARPGGGGDSAYGLVAPGKHGAAALVAGLDGRQARLRGALLYRDGRTMIEVVPGSIEPSAASPATPKAGEDLGVLTFRGEIVDSKCYLGVMNPGEGKPHRACAARCISGGIPPILVARGPEGRRVHLLLVSSEGRPVNQQILDLVGEPVEVAGRLLRHGDRLVLRADPEEIRRVRDASGASR